MLKHWKENTVNQELPKKERKKVNDFPEQKMKEFITRLTRNDSSISANQST